MAEKALTQIVHIMFKWVKYTEDVVSAYRMKQSKPRTDCGRGNLDGTRHVRRGRIAFLVVSLKDKNDEMSAVNKATMLKQGGFRVPDSELLEDLGYENPEMLASKWKDEQLESAALQNFIQELQMQLQMKQQAMQMQMQQAMQQEQMMQQQAMMQQAPQDPNAQGAYGQMANPDQGLPSNPQDRASTAQWAARPHDG